MEKGLLDLLLLMKKIVIISSSIRIGRNSSRVASFLKKFIDESNLANAEIADLDEYKFPLFDERLRFQKNPDNKVVEFANRIKSADAVVIVTPEYNGGYPASLKNVIDLLGEEWKKKPIGISTVSTGAFGGSQVITSLQFSLWKIGAWVIPVYFPVPNVDKAFDENGDPTDKEAINKRATTFLNELLWYAEAKHRMSKQ